MKYTIYLSCIYFANIGRNVEVARIAGKADKKNRQLPGQCDRTVSKVSLGSFALDETKSLVSSRFYMTLIYWHGGCFHLVQQNFPGWHGQSLVRSDLSNAMSRERSDVKKGRNTHCHDRPEKQNLKKHAYIYIFLSIC